jgi:hypothetical protein
MHRHCAQDARVRTRGWQQYGHNAQSTWDKLDTSDRKAPQDCIFKKGAANKTGLAYLPAIVCLMTCQDLTLKHTAVRSKGAHGPVARRANTPGKS